MSQVSRFGLGDGAGTGGRESGAWSGGGRGVSQRPGAVVAAATAILALLTYLVGIPGASPVAAATVDGNVNAEGAPAPALSAPLSNQQAASWGDNSDGQLGNNSTTTSSVPVAVDTSGVLAGKAVTQVSAGSFYTCAVVSGGGVFCWGSNASGELGNNSTTRSLVPVAVDMSGALAGQMVTQVAAGYSHTCAVVTGGAVSCWGGNASGELGNNSTTQSLVPVAVDTSGVLAGQTVAQVSAGTFLTCAVVSVGGVFCWGYNGYGQLGNGSTTDSAVPVAVNVSGVLAGKTVTQVAAGNGFTAAVFGTPVAPPAGAVFVPSAPIRAYDSRVPGAGGVLGTGQSRVVDVKVAGYPAGTVAIAYNVTVADSVGAGWLGVTPGDTGAAPNSSTINWDAPGATLANGYVVGVSPAGAVKVFAGGPGATQFVIDVVGFYVPESAGVGGAVFVPVDPARAYSSIGGGGLLSSGQSRNVSVAPGGVPAGATGVAYNLTVTNTSQQGWLAVTPQGTAASGSSINWTQAGQTYANGTQGQIASNAVTVTAGGGGATDFIIDVTGYFVPVGQDGGKGTRFTPLAPVRAYDSRDPGAGGRLNSSAARTTSMTTGTGVPVGAAAVVYNLTETETVSGGFLAVAPGGASTNASTINWFRNGQDMANGTVVKLNPAGQVTTAAGGGGNTGPGSTQYVIDIAGYYLAYE